MRKRSSSVLLESGVFLAVFAASLIPFLPALSNGFVNWDDPNFITGNAIIRGLSRANLVAMFTTYVDGNYIPLTFLSFAFNYALHGLQPIGFHATNLVLHALNAVLVVLLLRKMGSSLLGAACGALLFALHPLRVESVVWATERKDVLFALFYLLSLLAYLRYLNRRTIKPLLLSMLFFLASGLSKQMAISLPATLLLLDFAARRKWAWRVVVEKIPFALLALGFVAVAYWGQHAAGSVMRGAQYTPLHRLLLSTNSLVIYLKNFIWPLNLSAVYPYPKDVVAEAAYAPFVILVVLVAVIVAGRKYRPVWVSGLFLLVTLAPVLNVVPAGAQMVADRFLYLPAIALSYLLSISMTDRWPRWSNAHRTGVLMALTAVLVLLAALSGQRSKIWKDDLTLWGDAVVKAPTAFIARSNLALARLRAGDYRGAIRDFTVAAELSPAISDSYSNRGQAWRMLNQADTALADFTMAITLEPDNAIYRFNRAETYADRGVCDKAIPDYERAVELAPTLLDAQMGLGFCLGMSGRLNEAIAAFTAVLAQEPQNADALFNRGKAFYESKDLQAALADFDAIVSMDPGYAKALYHRAVVLMELNRMQEAWRDVKAVRTLGFSLPDDVVRRIPAELRK